MVKLPCDFIREQTNPNYDLSNGGPVIDALDAAYYKSTLARSYRFLTNLSVACDGLDVVVRFVLIVS